MRLETANVLVDTWGGAYNRRTSTKLSIIGKKLLIVYAEKATDIILNVC